MNTEKTPVNWYFHGARYFDPQLATWHSPDPLSESSTSLSPYTYVANNPVNFVDPNGMLYAKPSDWEREQAKEGAYCSEGGGFRSVKDPAEDLGPREAFLAVALIWF
ncbi:MAG: RHS repeat-associated core domain-containing protein, partial [Kosmotogaceae bacterium]